MFQENSNDSHMAENMGGHTTDSLDSCDNEKVEVLREQDRFLPIANISRIMKKSIPTNGKIAKEAKECLQECVSEFISFITSEASDRCKQEKRKTINGEDIIFAMATLGFDNYVEPLKVYLMKYRDFTMRNEKDSSSIKEEDSKDDEQISNGSSATTHPDDDSSHYFC